MGAVAVISFKDIGSTPVVLCDDGTLLPKACEWLISSKQKGFSPSVLDNRALAIARFHTFYERYHEQHQGSDLLQLFWKSLREGDPQLAWKSLRYKRSCQLWAALNLFGDWLSDTAGCESPNPLQEAKMTWHECIQEATRRVNSDMLAHLLPATRAGKGIKLVRKFDPRRGSNRHAPAELPQRRAFSLDRYDCLIAQEKNLRDLIVWLVLGAGGIRISEALNLWPCDILFNPKDETAEVKLIDPRFGPIEVTVAGRQVTMTRAEYLEKKYQLQPRDLLPSRDPMRAGWKGMRTQEPETQSSKITWMHPIYGKMLWAAHTLYLPIRNRIAPGHPYYLVNLTHNIGAPMTRRNAYGILKDTCARLAFPWPDFLHSLRHMYGDVLANKLKIDIHLVQVAIRHSSFLSTLNYTQPSLQSVADEMNRAHNQIR